MPATIARGAVEGRGDDGAARRELARDPRWRWWAFLVAFAACKASPPAAPPPSPARADAGAVTGTAGRGAAVAGNDARHDAGGPVAAAGPTPEALAAAQRLEARHCRKTGCCATEATSFGPDRRGRQLAVIALEDRPETCLLPQKASKGRRSAAPEEASQEGAGGGEGEGADRHACTAYWMVDVDGAKPPVQVRLASLCDGDHSEASGTVDVGKRTFTARENSVYSADRTWSTRVIGLDPLRLVETSHESMGRVWRDERWNWDELAGELVVGFDYCPGKTPPDAGAARRGDHDDDDDVAIHTRSVAIPLAAPPAEFIESGWRTTGLGRCSALVDGARGFAVRGGKGTPADATMRLLFAPHDLLFVELTDDRFVGSGKTWVQEDHLEIWAVATVPECVDPAAGSPAAQWGIRIRDGEVFAGFGAPEAKPAVEVATADRVVRLKIAFPQGSLAGRPFTAVYSDSDDGLHQKRLLATSELVYGRWWTLGEAPGAGTTLDCKVDRGVLAPRRPLP